MKKVAVVIPVYKENLLKNERMSLEQCQKVLGGYPIIFVAPEGLTLEYQTLLPQSKIYYFDRSYFESTKSYSRLMTLPLFYEAFLDFKYLLIYQTDAWVFEDRLEEWCEKGYDYVGAPKLRLANFLSPELVKSWRKDAHLLNGGFSLRKVSAMIRFTQLFNRFYSQVPVNEDQLFSCYFYRYIPLRPFIHLPNWKEALAFGFEKNPKISYKINQGIPFGCHAWEKYNPKFWEKFIP